MTDAVRLPTDLERARMRIAELEEDITQLGRDYADTHRYWLAAVADADRLWQENTELRASLARLGLKLPDA